MGGIDNRSKSKRVTLCCIPKCNNFGGHKFPSEATAKNAWIKWLDEPEKRQLGCRWQFHAVGPRSSLPQAASKSNFGDCSQRAQPPGPYVGPICLGANKSHIYPNMCAIFGRGPTVASREKGGRDTESGHEWLQDNFYGGSATKRIVIGRKCGPISLFFSSFACRWQHCFINFYSTLWPQRPLYVIIINK